MKAVIVIPARFGSKRFPGKPLALIHGKSLLQRVWSIAKKVKQIEDVYIATDNEKIKQHGESFGATVIMTPEHCENGTERVVAAVDTLNTLPNIIINLQGDAVLTPPWVIQALVDKMLADSTIELATIATQLNKEQYTTMLLSKQNGKVGGTTVVFDNHDNALYFSKSMIPFLRESDENNLPVYRHIGLYAYQYSMLKKYINLKPTTLEKVEGLEQLRALQNRIPIKIVKVDYQGRTHWAVDSMEDIKVAEKIIQNEGELI